MPDQPTNAGRRIVRFGIFEADMMAGEVRKNGVRVRLQEQPFQVLALLLECPGDIVTREQLREKLWPADTFVDFDHSLNTAINKIREALGDSASSPRFVETVARRGYRFLAAVQVNEDPSRADAMRPQPASGPTDAAAAQSPDVSLHPELEVPLPHRSLSRGLFALIQIMYLVFYVVALLHWEGVDRIADSFLPGWGALAIVVAVWLTALVGIPLRLYLFNAVAFDYRRLGEKFQRLFVLILLLDELWATAPFLLTRKIGVGTAFAATAALLYVPFSQRTLIRLAYPYPRTSDGV
jgi:DNA-binding winged helix-turn-helix (wHTH) protein